MIPMNCPGCGRPGTIPPDKLNARMHCKKCDAVFHMDTNGRIVLGEPTRPGDKPKKAKGRARQVKNSNPDISLPKLIQSVPKAAWIGVGVALLAILIFKNVDFNPPPESPLTNLQLIVKAAVNGDKSALSSLSFGKTAPDAEKWSEKIRSVGRLAGPYDDAAVLNQPDLRSTDDKNLVQVYNVKFIKLKDSSGHEVPLNIGVYLVQSRGRWYLDGEESLKNSDKDIIVDSQQTR